MHYLIKLKSLLQCKYFFVLLVLLSLSYSFIRNKLIGYSSVYDEEDNTFVGIITEISEKNNYYKITLKAKEKLIVNYYYKDKLDLVLGMKIKVVGKLNKPRANTTFNTFNYQKYLYNHYIYYEVDAKSLEVISTDIRLKYRIKNMILDRCNNFKNSSYFKALIIGDKKNFEDYQMYQRNGVSHLFAISGMHLSLMSGIILYLLKKNKYKEIFACMFLICFSIITNYSASIYRSLVFYLLLRINKRLDLQIEIKNILLLTISLLIFYNPLIIYDMGFLYSSMVSLGLIICKKYYKKNYIVNLMITSIVAFLFGLPITVYYNYEVNIFSVINNLIVVPFLSLVIYPGVLLTFICAFLEPLINILIVVLKFINSNLVAYFIIVPKVSLLFYLIYYIILYLFIVTNRKFFILLSLLYIYAFNFRVIFNYDRVVYFDVSQGDSSLVYINKKAYLIDCGGIKDKNISANLITYLKSIGVRKLNFIATHGDYDHMGEAINLVNNFKVKKVIFNCGEFNDLEKELIKVLDKKKIKYYSCIKELNIDNSKLYFLQTKEYDNENDNSNVIYTELDGYKFMFMGDAGVEKEKDILNKYNISGIDILKIGHHGSKTSSSKEFINEINPNYSIISVGKNNRYGHPNKEVLNNLSDSKIYRTDHDGSVIFKIKNNKLEIEICSP